MRRRPDPREGVDWEGIDWAAINRVHDELLAAVQALDGTVWLRSFGELHSPYLEMPFWIVVAPECDMVEVHRRFTAIVAPRVADIAPVNCTVAYAAFEDGREHDIAFFDGNQAILSGRTITVTDLEPVGMRGRLDGIRDVAD